MENFDFKFSKRDLVLIYILAAFLIFEFFFLVFLLYLSRFPVFIYIFTQALVVISPVFIGFSMLLFIVSLFAKGRELIVKVWTKYIKELVRLSILSLLFAIALFVSSFVLGFLALWMLRFLSHTPAIDRLTTSLQDWIARNSY